MTARLTLVATGDAAPDAAAILGMIQAAYGMTPNVFRVMANAPAALAGYAGWSQGLEAGSLSGREREQIALFVATRNDCAYCLAAHRGAARFAGMSPADIAAAESGSAVAAREQAILALVSEAVQTTGAVTDGALEAARNAGLSDGDIVEIVAHIALNTFANTLNRLAQTPVDFL